MRRYISAVKARSGVILQGRVLKVLLTSLALVIIAFIAVAMMF